MEPMQTLADVYLANVKTSPPAPAELGSLEGALRHALEAARAQWPGVALEDEVFVQHVAERLPAGGSDAPLEARLAAFEVSELYLACACARGNPAALATFERQYLARLPGLLGSMNQPAAVIDEVRQRVRVKLLVRTADAEPRIAEYTGRGPLMSWVRVTAVRDALKLIEPKQVSLDDEMEAVEEDLAAQGDDPEMAAIRKNHQAEFREALRGAFSTLSSEERHLFRLCYLDRLNQTQLAGLFQVSQPAISRWLKSSREKVYEETKRRLQERLGLSSREYLSFLKVLDSQIYVGMSQILREEDAPPPSPAGGAGGQGSKPGGRGPLNGG